MDGLVAAADVAAAAASSGDVWDALGPYLLTGCGTLALTAFGMGWKRWQDAREVQAADIKWLKRNVTNMLVELGIKPVSED